VTQHGFALNCNNSLEAYHSIVPCGIKDATVTTLSEEVGRTVSVTDVLPVLISRLPELILEYAGKRQP
jgi:lipoyl(octanoyl) transferase